MERLSIADIYKKFQAAFGQPFFILKRSDVRHYAVLLVNNKNVK
ncbi:hypothetical protein CHCC15381_4227 [Bacillus paralicheniformis]|uniref:Uncharacterized protein n=1 Tax=Bacillus paralicheniformis TaxID=1648923 RepID=A0ABY3FTP2_9BACI|nr:hypothetical protein CHCC15381_4227 [Bacillus paralicheniformis]